MPIVIATGLDWQQVILTGGVSLLCIFALGLFFYKKGWPLILERVKRQDTVTENYQTALREQIATTHKILTEQAEYERTQRKAELTAFTDSLAQQRREFLQTNKEQRAEFLTALRQVHAGEQKRGKRANDD
jgi:hypothetical protein